jgi:hypothetical protein
MLKRSLVFAHRWLGVLACLLFLTWFLSGIGMMYWDYPAVTPADRLAHSPALDVSRIIVSAADAYASLNDPEPPVDVRLNSFDGRPVYRFCTGPREAIVYADTGEHQNAASADMMGRIAAAWTGQPARAATAVSVDVADQWTLKGSLRTMRPLWKFSWPSGEQVYVSQSSGEVVQFTTSGSRLRAFLGPIPHWFYFTPFRRHGLQWTRLVIWSSGLATITALLGVVIGAWMYSPRRQYRRRGLPTSIPYDGQKRWHHALGLIFGVAAVTWAFSGMLSMDPFPLASRQAQETQRVDSLIATTLRGPIQLGVFSLLRQRRALAQLNREVVKELELASVVGEPWYIATLESKDTRVVPLDGPPQATFSHQRLADALRADTATSGGAEISLLDHYDRYYEDRRRERPLPVLLVQRHDPGRSRNYIDWATARIVGSYNTREWASRWLYHALHSLDFPWLYDHRPAWDIVVISFMLGGAALSLTGVVIAWRAVTSRVAGALGLRSPS